MEFAASLLARVNQNQKAAQAAEQKKKSVAAAQRQAAVQAKAAEEKAAIRKEADKLVQRNVSHRARLPARRRVSATNGVSKPRNKRPSSERIPRPKPKEVGPPKALPGMEFVVRREKKKEIRVPHPSDYSDLFGDEYLRGIDLKCVKEMKHESAKATEEAKRILEERKRKAEKLLREAKEREQRMEGMDEKHKLELKRKVAESDWVAVEAPPAKGEMAVPIAKSGGVSSVPSGGKVKTKAMKQAEITQRSKALKERILAATGGGKGTPNSAGEGAKRRREDGEDRRSREIKRPRYEERDRFDRDRFERDRYERDRSRDRSRDRDRGRDRDRDRYRSRYERERGYNSEEWYSDQGSDRDDDDDSDEDLFGIEALDREEEISSRYAAMEDKRERMKEAKRKKEKEQRREEYERTHQRD